MDKNIPDSYEAYMAEYGLDIQLSDLGEAVFTVIEDHYSGDSELQQEIYAGIEEIAARGGSYWEEIHLAVDVLFSRHQNAPDFVRKFSAELNDYLND